MPARLRVIITIAITVVVIGYLLVHYRDFRLLGELRAIFLVPLIVAPLLAIVANGLTLHALVLKARIALRFTEWFGLTVLHAFANYLPLPHAGIVARGFYLKQIRDLDLTTYSATVVVNYVLFLSVLGAVGITSIAWFSYIRDQVPWPLWALFGLMAFAPIPVLIFARTTSGSRWLARFSTALAQYRDPAFLLQVIALQLVVLGVSTVALWSAFAGLGRPVEWSDCLVLSAIWLATGLINVTPGNIGIAEAAGWLTARLLGNDPGEAVVAFTLVRLCALLVVLVLAPVFTSSLSATRPTSTRASASVHKHESDEG